MNARRPTEITCKPNHDKAFAYETPKIAAGSLTYRQGNSIYTGRGAREYKLKAGFRALLPVITADHDSSVQQDKRNRSRQHHADARQCLHCLRHHTQALMVARHLEDAQRGQQHCGEDGVRG